MKFKKTGFRAFYHHFCACELKEYLKDAVRAFPGAGEADCILTYGYIDESAGLTLEVLACGKRNQSGFRFFDTASDIRSFIRMASAAEEEFFFFDDKDGALADRYREKLGMLRFFDAPEEVEKARDMSFLDGCRQEYCVDDVLVYLMREGLEPEGCWTRIIGLGEHWFIGKLLNEPDQSFGWHEGDEIAFFARKTEDNQIICYSDVDPGTGLTEADLADGKMLEEAAARFNAEGNEENFIEVLEILRDSYVWIPCSAILSSEDQAGIEARIAELGDDLDGIIGETLVTHDPTALVPDILQNEEAFFFPVFSTAEAMGEYGNRFSKIQMHILEVIPLARNNEKDVAGIVLNAFSDPFVLDRDIWDILENMESRIQS